jgi:hypothetical protein
MGSTIVMRDYLFGAFARQNNGRPPALISSRYRDGAMSYA